MKTTVDGSGDPVNNLNGSQAEHPERTSDDRVPLERFRPGYLWVSDLTRQHWCEQQLWYSLTLPVVVEENPVMTEGSSLHLARGILQRHHHETCHRAFRPGPTQTGLYNHRNWLEA